MLLQNIQAVDVTARRLPEQAAARRVNNPVATATAGSHTVLQADRETSQTSDMATTQRLAVVNMAAVKRSMRPHLDDGHQPCLQMAHVLPVPVLEQNCELEHAQQIQTWHLLKSFA